jgi:hypothetical protein
MLTPPDPSTLELLTWVSGGSRSYGEAMDVWGSHCPRHPVWEEALAVGLVRVVRVPGERPRSEVALTASGQAALAAAGDGRA